MGGAAGGAAGGAGGAAGAKKPWRVFCAGISASFSDVISLFRTAVYAVRVERDKGKIEAKEDGIPFHLTNPPAAQAQREERANQSGLSLVGRRRGRRRAFDVARRSLRVSRQFVTAPAVAGGGRAIAVGRRAESVECERISLNAKGAHRRASSCSHPPGV